MTRAIFIIVLLLQGLAFAEPDRVFSVNGVPARRAVVTAPWVPAPPAEIPGSMMRRTLRGIAGELSIRELRDLERAVAQQTRVPLDTRIAEPLWAVHLENSTGNATISIGRVEDGWLLVETATNRVRLEQTAFERVAAGWTAARPDPTLALSALLTPALNAPGIDPDSETGGADAVVLSPSPVASPVRLDTAELSRRFARGGPSPFADSLTRSIDNEAFSLRLPPTATTDRPLGLLVWINPTESSDPPPQLFEAADAHTLAIIAPGHAGNDRPVVDRLQLALDAVRTAATAVWIDPDRVYIAGMSGGGRLASMLWAGAPDIFTGAIGIVGLNSHHQVPTGKGTVWPASHRLPAGDLARTLRTHPIAAISGPRDFNFTESRLRIARLKREGFNARLFDIPRLAHTMPDSDALLNAVAWLERPLTERRAETARQAQRILDRLPAEVLENPEAPLADRHRRALERVTLLAPWTEPAWNAAARLGDTATPPGAP